MQAANTQKTQTMYFSGALKPYNVYNILTYIVEIIFQDEYDNNRPFLND